MLAGRFGHVHKMLTEKKPQETLGIVAASDHQGLMSSRETLHRLLEECNRRKDLAASRWVYSLVVNNGLDSTAYLGDHAIRMFASCGSLVEATQVFLRISNRSVYTWTALISAHAKLGESYRALELFSEMQKDGIEPDKFVLSCFLKVCGSLGSLRQGRLIHHHIINSGLKSDAILGNTLLDTYAKCGSVEEAWKVFENLPYRRDLVSWSIIFAAYINHGHDLYALELYDKMKRDGIQPDKVVFLCILKASSNMGAISCGFMIHDKIIRRGLETDIAVGSSLLDTYAKCGSIREACKVFETLSHPNVVSWGAMISGFAEHGHGTLALKLYECMQQEGIKPDKVIFLCILKACGNTGEAGIGRLIHEHILQAELEIDMVVGSSIIDMYAKCGSLEDARKVFNRLSSQDVVSWGTMIAGYAQNGQAVNALALFRKMEQEGIQPSIATFLSSLKACGSIGDLDAGMLLHDQIVRSALDVDEAIGSSLVDMYAKFGNVEGSRKVFDKLPQLSAVSCGAMIAGYAEHGQGLLALGLFGEMDMGGTQVDNITFLYMLKACASIGSLGDGRWIHHRIIQISLELDLVLGNSLVEMYSKCCSLEEARKVFENMRSRDVVSWGAIIAGYAQSTNSGLAGHYLKEMQKSGLEPNDTIYTCLLAACSHGGLVNAGCHYFTLMRDEHGISPSVEHYSCMIDLLGRSGCVLEAEDLIETIPVAPNVIMWTAMLSSCRAYGNTFLGQRCFDQFVQTDPDDGSGYVLVSDTYANVHMREDVDKIQELKSSVGACKKPGRAWIEVNDRVNEFVVGGSVDFLPPKLDRLRQQSKKGGYVPMVTLVIEQW